MTIWEEIEEARKKKDYGMGALGFIEIIPTLKIGPLSETTEFEDRAKKAIDEFLSIRPNKVTDEVERRACGAVLSYLLCYSHDQYLEKCTEYQISLSLGIPRPRLRKLLSRLAWDGVIESVGVGLSSPYKIINMGKAMGEGYFQSDPEEAMKVAKIVHSPWQTVQLIERSLISSLPESVPFTEAEITIYNTINSPNQVIEPIMIPFHPGQVDHNYPQYNANRVDIFLSGVPGDWLTKEVLLELDVPEKVTAREVREGLKRVGEKYLRLARIRIRPLLRLLEKHGFEEGRKMIEKAYLRDRLLEMEHDSRGRRIPNRKGLRQGQGTYLLNRSVVPGHGEVSLHTQELTPTHIAFLASVYRLACSFAENVGGDPKLVEDCRREAAQLISFIEPEAGKESQEGEA